MRRPLAVFTIVQEEPEFFHRWLDHYCRQVKDPGDIYVLDHVSTTGWTATLKTLQRGRSFNLLQVHNTASFDHAWLADTVSQFQSFLLQSYDAVLFVEVDEIVVLRNAKPLFDRACRLLGGEMAVRCSGYEVVHRPGEAALDPDQRPWLSQRKWWYPSVIYSKTLLARTPLQWGQGFHSVIRGLKEPPARRPELLLLHLHKIDFDIARRKHNRTARRNWSKTDRDRRRGYQNAISDPNELWEWFGKNIDAPNRDAPFVEIPNDIKELV